VALPSGVQTLIPEWMRDDDRCHGMEIAERPSLAVTALFALRELVDAQLWTSEQTSAVASEASSPGGAFDELTTAGSSAVGDSPHTRVAADHATELPRVMKSLAAGSREHNPNLHRRLPDIDVGLTLASRRRAMSEKIQPRQICEVRLLDDRTGTPRPPFRP